MCPGYLHLDSTAQASNNGRMRSHLRALLSGFTLVALLASGCKRGDPASAPASAADASAATPGNPKVPAGAKSSGGKIAAIETDKGVIEIELFPQMAPKAVENFRLLAEHGYYNGLTFHRVVRGFMIQGGDPMGDGRGGMSAWGGAFPDEIDRNSEHYRGGTYKRGIIAMANRGPNTNTSQFFIMHQDYRLPPNYVIFGKVLRGMEVVDALVALPTRMGTDGDMSAPVTPIVMKKVTIKP
jgi:cyclophilin family peptidyl-prolyl cis-trans isomerase